MKRLPDEQQNDIIARYQRGEQSKDIAAIHGIRDNSVARILRKHGIARTKVKRLPQEQLDKAVKMYIEDKISSEIIATQFDVDSNVIRRAIIKAGFEIRPATENKRRYKIDDKFFETIDREANAYFLGFLYADGSLTTPERGNGIKLSLKEDDIAILETFSSLIYGFIKVKTDTHKDGRRYSRVNVYSQKMHADLIKLGCTPKKSFTIKFPTTDIVPDHLMHHFIRGFMDGDGCICITDDHRPRVDFTSTLEFLEGLQGHLVEKLGIKFAKIGQRHPERDNNTRNIQTLGFDNCRKLLDHLYSDATIFLDRKKVKYDELLQQQSRHGSKKLAKYTDPTKYGTSYIPSINGIHLTKENLATLSQTDKDALIEPLFAIYRENGFPYPKIDDDALLKDFLNVKNADLNNVARDDVLQPTNYSGTGVFKHFSPHFYEVNDARHDRPSMLDTFNDDELLHKVIKNRIDQNFSMTGNELKAGLANSKIAFKASIFNSVLARYIYTQYTKPNSIIYDYSMGFGQRLLGALALPYRITYVGVDPYDKTVQSNQDIFNFYDANIPMFDREVDLRCIGSEGFCDETYTGKVDLAFSSPPYYNLEVYSDDNSQAYSTSYVDFLHRYWRKTVSNIDKMLTKEGRFILNITDEVDGFEIGNDMANVVREAGFVLEHQYKLQLSRNLEFRGKKEGHRYEPIYVFKRA